MNIRKCIYEFCDCKSRSLPRVGNRRVNGIGYDYEERNLHKKCIGKLFETRDGLCIMIRHTTDKKSRRLLERELLLLCNKYDIPYEDPTYEEELQMLNK